MPEEVSEFSGSDIALADASYGYTAFQAQYARYKWTEGGSRVREVGTFRQLSL